MAQKSTATNNKGSSQTLGSLLKYLEGIELVVELKTGRRYRGTLNSSDDHMNLTLDNAEEEGRRGEEQKADYSSATSSDNLIDILSSSLNIRGSNIRYIHFPDNANLTGLVRVGVERERAAKNMYRRGKRKS